MLECHSLQICCFQTLPHMWPSMVNLLSMNYQASALCHVANTLQYCSTWSKSHWMDTTCKAINWVQIKWLCIGFLLTITSDFRSIHEYLPLKGANHTSNANSSSICLLGQCNNWDNMSLLWIWTPRSTIPFSTAPQWSLQCLHTTHHIDPHIHQLL